MKKFLFYFFILTVFFGSNSFCVKQNLEDVFGPSEKTQETNHARQAREDHARQARENKEYQKIWAKKLKNLLKDIQDSFGRDSVALPVQKFVFETCFTQEVKCAIIRVFMGIERQKEVVTKKKLRKKINKYIVSSFLSILTSPFFPAHKQFFLTKNRVELTRAIKSEFKVFLKKYLERESQKKLAYQEHAFLLVVCLLSDYFKDVYSGICEERKKLLATIKDLPYEKKLPAMVKFLGLSVDTERRVFFDVSRDLRRLIEEPQPEQEQKQRILSEVSVNTTCNLNSSVCETIFCDE